MSRREFPAKVRLAAFQRAGECCESCGVRLQAGRIHYDHVIPDALGGEPTLENCECLCAACHGRKTAGQDVPRIAKAKRQQASHIGAKPPSKTPMPFGRRSKFKKKLNGTVVPR